AASDARARRAAGGRVRGAPARTPRAAAQPARRAAGLDAGVDRPREGPAAARLPLRRADDRLRRDAGAGLRRRPPGRVRRGRRTVAADGPKSRTAVAPMP